MSKSLYPNFCISNPDERDLSLGHARIETYFISS